MNKLKGKLVEKGVTYQHCADYLGISKVTFVKKINGQTQFTLKEVREISNLLNLTNEDKIAFFLL